MTIIEWVAAGMLTVLALQIGVVTFVIWRVEREDRQPPPRDPLIEAIRAEAMRVLREDFRGQAHPSP